MITMMLNQSMLSAQSPQDLLQALEGYAGASRVVEHPLFDAICRMPPVDARAALQIVLRQYYHYSMHFTRYLGAVLAGLERVEHRALILANMSEENGALAPEHEVALERVGLRLSDVSQPHPLLFQRFLCAIEMSSLSAGEPGVHLATQAWVQTMLDLCRGSAAQAVGALGIGTEGVVKHIYKRMLQAIRYAWPNLSAYERAFFELHALVDDSHAEGLRQVALGLLGDETARVALACGVVRAIGARADFFDSMHAAVVPQTRCYKEAI